MARTRRSEAGGLAPGPRSRLFLALDLPAHARVQVAAWRDELVAGRDDLRPVAVDALHVTLVFLGARPDEEVGRIGALTAEAAALDPPLLAAAGVAAVPARSPRLLALDLRDDGERATVLHGALSNALAAAGLYVPEKRPFWPHVTLARVKRGARWAPAPASEPAAVAPPEPFEAGEVTLYKSTLRPQGALYEPLLRTRLGSSRPA